MVQVVLSLEEKYNQKLRHLAQLLYHNKKGAISEVVENSLDAFEKGLKREKAYSEMLHEIQHAKNWGVKEFKREEAYE